MYACTEACQGGTNRRFNQYLYTFYVVHIKLSFWFSHRISSRKSSQWNVMIMIMLPEEKKKEVEQCRIMPITELV